MSPKTEREWIARILTSLVGGPACAMLLMSVKQINLEGTLISLFLIAACHGWFLILNMEPQRTWRK